MIIFASIFGFGFLILLISLIFGGDADIDADVDIDSDIGHGPSIFSIKMIAMLMVGFGATGFGMRATTDWTMFQSSMAGMVGAVVLGSIGYLILRMFYASQASSTIDDSDIIGQQANLIDMIDNTRNGQISCIIRGREFTFLARSSDGQTINKGAIVKITGKTGNIVTVEKVQ
ncbi:MAG: NfeD family protein [Candidatus Zixiibacteriota bacterium]